MSRLKFRHGFISLTPIYKRSHLSEGAECENPLYHGNRDLRLETVPDSKPGHDEVLIHVDYYGICATDVEEYLHGPIFISGDKPNPITGKKILLISSHEITVINGMLSCKVCYCCKRGEVTQCPSIAAAGFNINGGLADFISWLAANVIRLPYNVSSEQAALPAPSAVTLHAIRRSRLQLGETAAIIGVRAVGMLAMQAVKVLMWLLTPREVKTP